MTTSPESPGPADVEGVPVPPSDDRDNPVEDDEMMQGGVGGEPRGGQGRGRGHQQDEDDENERARRNVGG
jgi:hypothetical protein